MTNDLTDGRPRSTPAEVRIIAFLWGLQFSFLNPALALVLVSVFGASNGQVAVVLVIYNSACLVTSFVIPRWADRHGDYLRPMVGCAVFTVALAIALSFAHALPLAVVGLVLLGAPAAVGTPLLFGFVRHSGAPPSAVVRTRAMFSTAWVAGPPLASVIISTAGGHTLVAGIGVVGALNVVAITRLRLRTRTGAQVCEPAPSTARQRTLVARRTIALIMIAFAGLQAASTTTVAITTLFVTKNLQLSPVWGGIALGLAAGLEVPTLYLVGHHKRRIDDLTLLSFATVVGIAYDLTMSVAPDGATVIAAQVLNAAFYGVVAGIGITLFQSIIAGPGAAAGLLSNAQRGGALLAGPLVGIGSYAAGGLRGVFVACAVVTGIALVVLRITYRHLRPATGGSAAGDREPDRAAVAPSRGETMPRISRRVWRRAAHDRPEGAL